MKRAHDHTAAVASWMLKIADGRPPAQLVRASADAFAGMWRRAVVTLGEVTLAAILERVLHESTARFPVLESLRMNAGVVDFGPVVERAASVDAEALRQALVFFLTRFLTVLGNLTADILSRALHSELSKHAEKP